MFNIDDFITDVMKGITSQLNDCDSSISNTKPYDIIEIIKNMDYKINVNYIPSYNEKMIEKELDSKYGFTASITVKDDSINVNALSHGDAALAVYLYFLTIGFYELTEEDEFLFVLDGVVNNRFIFRTATRTDVNMLKFNAELFKIFFCMDPAIYNMVEVEKRESVFNISKCLVAFADIITK